MKFEKLKIKDIVLIKPKVHEDVRGKFSEVFKQKELNNFLKNDIKFVQENFSSSSKNVLRGMHYQVPPFEQGKLIQVTKGKIFDVALDIRKNSNTFGKYVSYILSASNLYQLWIPPGFAHGFYVMSDSAEILYKCTNYYSKESERTIVWNDETTKIKWPINIEPILSEKDSNASSLNDSETL